MEMLVKAEKFTLLIIATLHLALQLIHSYSHAVSGVQNTSLQQLFILLVVTIMPWVAVYVAWNMSMRNGSAIFSLSMAASFLFGYVLHFVINTPDLHLNVLEEHRGLFFHSASLLALLEFVGASFGVYFFARSPM